MIPGRQAGRVWWGASLAAALVLMTLPLAVHWQWGSVLSVAILSWLSWQRRPQVQRVDYRPGSVTLLLADGSRWQVSAGQPAVCMEPLLAVRAQCGDRSRWLNLFADQLPAGHWRRLSAILRWL